ncbi:DUF6197 family protein [Brucella haematophila]|uniref:Uncharacterized protein n=1 Tax=Brucella haematophila TaxID=419474 RepID=A0ABX1DIH6_9HYPH|nr:hypothetical protein [Brucella haematophila]NKC02772.1 hypothetical protein [Brucella haematophila]TMV03625.1 hypothetical protein FGI60_10705 [Brucella haematophila]
MSKIAKIMCALSATFVLVSAPVEAASFGARGGFSGGRSSFSSRSFSAPRSYSAPRTYSAPRSYSAPRTTTRTIIRENHYRSSGGGFRTIPDFNDDPDTTHADVLRMFNRAIVAAEDREEKEALASAVATLQ